MNNGTVAKFLTLVVQQDYGFIADHFMIFCLNTSFGLRPTLATIILVSHRKKFFRS